MIKKDKTKITKQDLWEYAKKLINDDGNKITRINIETHGEYFTSINIHIEEYNE